MSLSLAILLWGVALMAIASLLIRFEGRPWFRSWYVIALLILAGPASWLSIGIWWLADRLRP